MLDRYSSKVVKGPLNILANVANRFGVKADQISIIGFCLGCCAFPAIVFGYLELALVFILLNRTFDGLDGAVARKHGPSDAGGFLDISLDFVFYSMIPFAFVIANPAENAIAGAFLIFAFVGTGSSFLAFAVMAGKRGIENPVYKHKSLYYMSGLTEGTETIACFVIFCLWPQYFNHVAYLFGAACWFTTFTRIHSGFHTLNSNQG
ncbi:CDP-alcohol phosphatidyltransferase family protein [Vibrio marisflavi]|uniref:Inner membrane protein YnjF n=1 Tax=Vibrio marisflavi CECT 7928 TaxID=634439 RepID=A0ABM9A5I5_9VIBR|nr:CDP-alcohol phosphatidyltransferase family protein [Vibrio marisflavi]CAH0540437.1 Inner membrane protein YnjF [Vibrio marisflavi CECT 7928]